MTIFVQEIKAMLLQYHRERGYKIFRSFPLVSDDPTIMFVNATITPFKSWFTNPDEEPKNYALIQRCFRIGGANELDSVGVNPYCHTFFEMFGSGTFALSHMEAIQYLLELLDILGLEKQRLYFTIPNDSKFKSSLTINSIGQSHIFTLENNGVFWQEWRFGEFGPVGKGLTVIYSRSEEKVQSIGQMATDPDRFVELLNLIYVYGQEAQDGKAVPVPNPGFDLGLGIERLAAVLQGCDNYQINTIRPFVEIVVNFFRSQGYNLDETVTRILTDHFRAICVLIDEGLKPSNKKHGYALRKLIRRCLELAWYSAGQIVSTEILIERFCDQLGQCGVQRTSRSIIVTIFKEESRALCKVIQKAKRILEKQPDVHPDVLWDTYGLSPKLATIIKRKEDAI